MVRSYLATGIRQLAAQKLFNVAVQENVLVQLENLRTHPAVASGLSRDALKLHGWVYKIETGEVFAYDPRRGQFVPVAEIHAVPALAKGTRDRVAI